MPFSTTSRASEESESDSEEEDSDLDRDRDRDRDGNSSNSGSKSTKTRKQKAYKGPVMRKLRHHVSYPEILDLEEYTTSTSTQENEKCSATGRGGQKGSSYIVGEEEEEEGEGEGEGGPNSGPAEEEGEGYINMGKSETGETKSERVDKAEKVHNNGHPLSVLSRTVSSPLKVNTLQLFAVVVHLGHSLTAGHYVSYVRGEVGGKEVWYRMDDSRVTLCSKEEALAQEAYMLFYQKDVHRPLSAPSELGQSYPNGTSLSNRNSDGSGNVGMNMNTNMSTSWNANANKNSNNNNNNNNNNKNKEVATVSDDEEFPRTSSSLTLKAKADKADISGNGTSGSGDNGSGYNGNAGLKTHSSSRSPVKERKGADQFRSPPRKLRRLDGYDDSEDNGNDNDTYQLDPSSDYHSKEDDNENDNHGITHDYDSEVHSSVKKKRSRGVWERLMSAFQSGLDNDYNDYKGSSSSSKNLTKNPTKKKKRHVSIPVKSDGARSLLQSPLPPSPPSNSKNNGNSKKKEKKVVSTVRVAGKVMGQSHTSTKVVKSNNNNAKSERVKEKSKGKGKKKGKGVLGFFKSLFS